MPAICHACGNNHYGSCATEQTCFIWRPQSKAIPQQVFLTGSWKKWQTQDKMNKQTTQNGEVFFKISLTLLAGIYEYKYIVDGQWKHDPYSASIEDSQYGTLNNVVKVYPKKMFLPVNKDGQVKISSYLLIDGLKLIGSWDNWNKEISMTKIFNHLKGCEQFVANVHLQINKQYQFKFKLKKQFLIDEKYPTISNNYNTQNNIIITFSPDHEEIESQKKEKKDTPIKLSGMGKTIKKDFSCKSFQWLTYSRTFDVPYKRVQGHSMCAIGDYIYIFGGYCRCEFYNSLTKLNMQLTSARTEQALPPGRSFHNMVTYGNKIIVFGGHNKHVIQDYYSFNVTEEKWAVVPHISGKYPQKKQKQSCVIYEMLMVFFGGYFCSSDFQYEVCYNTISVLDIENMKWIDQIEVIGEQPVGRFAHTAAIFGSDMYIFGGIYNANENQNLNDIWKINLEKVNELKWVEIQPKGKKPCPRHGHTMTTLHNYIVVIGGQDNDSQALSDIFIFNTTENQWFEPMIKGEIPRPRYYHAATLIQNDQILIFGGRTNNNKVENLYVLKPLQKVAILDIEQQDIDE